MYKLMYRGYTPDLYQGGGGFHYSRYHDRVGGVSGEMDAQKISVVHNSICHLLTSA